jgi:hypothetical protein
MLFTVGFSTLGNGVSRCFDVALDNPDVNFIIVHQKNSLRGCDNIPSNVCYIKSDTIGLSKSRNLLLANCQTKYLLISDDDVTFPSNLTEVLESAIVESKYSDLILGRIYSKEDQKFYKSYSLKNSVSILGLFSISSIEMLLNVEFVKEKEINFDESFGLGAVNKSGEELIVAADIRAKKGKIYSYAGIFSHHPLESSGKLILSNPKLGVDKGKMIRRAFGLLKGFPLLCLFSLKFFFKSENENRVLLLVNMFIGFFR